MSEKKLSQSQIVDTKLGRYLRRVKPETGRRSITITEVARAIGENEFDTTSAFVRHRARADERIREEVLTLVSASNINTESILEMSKIFNVGKEAIHNEGLYLINPSGRGIIGRYWVEPSYLQYEGYQNSYSVTNVKSIDRRLSRAEELRMNLGVDNKAARRTLSRLMLGLGSYGELRKLSP